MPLLPLANSCEFPLSLLKEGATYSFQVFALSAGGKAVSYSSNQSPFVCYGAAGVILMDRIPTDCPKSHPVRIKEINSLLGDDDDSEVHMARTRARPDNLDMADWEASLFRHVCRNVRNYFVPVYVVSDAARLLMIEEEEAAEEA